MARYAPIPADTYHLVPLGLMTACYLRRSGETHLLADPAPHILDALAADPADAAALTARLAQKFDLTLDDEPQGSSDPAQLSAMVEAALAELAALGLVTRLDG